MADAKEEKPATSLQSAELTNLKSLGSLNLLHQQLDQLRASVSQFLYPLHRPQVHSSAASLAETFAQQAQISSSLLNVFTSNHNRHKRIFDFVNEKYEANPKGLLSFRVPTAEEKALTSPPAGRLETVARTLTIPPPAIQFFDDGLDDMAQISQDWETFKTNHPDIQCERQSDTEFTVSTTSPLLKQMTFPKPVQFLTLSITLTPLRSKETSYTLAISTPKPPSSDLHTTIIKELSQHKKPASFAQFLVPVPV